MTTEHTNQIDIDRAKRAMIDIYISGLPDTGMRKALIEEAIAAIQTDPDNCFTGRYLGIKNYAAFGDQREDHEYGMGPRHGSIVFEIGRTSRSRAAHLGADHIYLLEAVRDAGAIEIPWEKDHCGRTVTVNICGAIRRLLELRDRLSVLFAAINSKQIESTELIDTGGDA